MKGHAVLAAFRVERRSVAVAVFSGTRLEFADVRQLSSIHQKAETSASGFVSWIVSTFNIESTAIELFENGQELLRAQLHREVEQTLSSSGVVIYKVGKAELLKAFGYPPLGTRKELRQVITSIWPILDTRKVSGTKLDAVALGLYLQTERLFQN